MNDPSIKCSMNNRMVCLTVSSLVIISCTLIVPVIAQPPAQKKSGGKTEWPIKAPYDDAICAFDKALTKASRDKEFRKRLTKSCESAKEAVSEIGNINIPDDRIIIFYEGEAVDAKAWSKIDHDKIKEALGDSRSSEKIHVFVLPPWKDRDTAEYRYAEYFVGMYDFWLMSGPPCQLPRP